MSEYQAIYDAVRSRISGGNIGDIARDVLFQQFDISLTTEIVKQEILCAVAEYRRPSAVYRPQLMIDGTAWCALYGENLQDGVAGFGDTPDEAMRAFDAAWIADRTPDAIRKAKASDRGLGGTGDES
jgi:hypothetical protein